jgi:hypothetical protein
LNAIFQDSSIFIGSEATTKTTDAIAASMKKESVRAGHLPSRGAEIKHLNDAVSQGKLL